MRKLLAAFRKWWFTQSKEAMRKGRLPIRWEKFWCWILRRHRFVELYRFHRGDEPREYAYTQCLRCGKGRDIVL